MSLTKLNHILVGGIPTPLKKKNMKVTWDDDIPNRWKNKKCSKPQTSIYIYVIVKLLCH